MKWLPIYNIYEPSWTPGNCLTLEWNFIIYVWINWKKYKSLLGEAAECPPIKEEETVIDMVSLEELAKIANNLLKPILHKIEPNEHIYWVVDGLTRYRYVVKEE